MKKQVFIFITISLLMAGCANNDPQQLKEILIGGPKEERVVPVGVLCIDTIGTVVRNSYPGYLEEGQSIDLAFKYGGTLERLSVKEGSHVSKGQTLAAVSSPTLENTLRSAEATLNQAQDAYDRLKKVHDNGSLPEIKWKEMEADLEKAQASYDLAKAMIDENTLKAPFSGTVTSVNATLGENITPLKPVMRIISSEGLAVKISIPENEIADIQVNDVADIRIPALNDREYSGQVVEKGMTATLLTHSYPVKVLINNPDKDLCPGMIGKVTLQAAVSKGIVVPANAILINQEGKFVWVVEQGRATRRSISIEGYSGQGVIVGKGLQSGDHVIVEGYQKVSEGMKVKSEERRTENGERRTENGERK